MSYIVVYRKLLLTLINSNLYILVPTNYYITTQKHHPLGCSPQREGDCPKSTSPPHYKQPLTTQQKHDHPQKHHHPTNKYKTKPGVDYYDY